MSRPLLRAAAVLTLAASLGACQLTAPPAPVVQAPPPGNVIKVVAGDTVYRIAQRHNVSLRAVIEANRLAPPYRLLVGQTLVIPAAHEHVVASGETLTGIAQRYHVAVAELARLNDIKPPHYVVKVGQRLALPGAPPPAAAPAPLVAKAENRPAAVQAQPLAEPEAMPTLTGSRVLMVAMSPAVAGGRGQPERASASAPAPAPAQSPEPQPARQAVQQVAARSTVDRPVEKPADTADSFAPLAEPPAMKGGFTWPARGKLIARFGAFGKGLHNDGINIEVPRGAPVRAAADGVVAYAGNELRGFGNLLLIKHANGWMSAYGHNDELLVRRGDKVRRGQVISKAGASGNVRSPQLHFELRKNADAVDPLPHLPEFRAGIDEPRG